MLPGQTTTLDASRSLARPGRTITGYRWILHEGTEVNGIFNMTNALAYGQFLGTRCRDRSNLIWILGGDKAPSTPEAVAVWRAMAKGITLGVAGREEDAEHIRAARGDDYALFSTPTGKPFRVRLDKLAGKQVKAWWFDPRSGQTTAVGLFASEGEREFIPPGEPGVGNDWVLLLDDPQRGFGPPQATSATRTVTSVTPLEWLRQQTPPRFKPGHTLPRLGQMHCVNPPAELRAELARHWGFAVRLSRPLGEPELLRLCAEDPVVFKPAGMIGNLANLESDRSRNWPEGTFLRQADGTLVAGRPIFSPEMPDPAWRIVIEEAIRQIAGQLGGLPAEALVTVEDWTEYGLTVPIHMAKHGVQDPKVAAAKGTRSWQQYTSERKAHYEKQMQAALKPGTPTRSTRLTPTAGLPEMLLVIGLGTIGISRWPPICPAPSATTTTSTRAWSAPRTCSRCACSGGTWKSRKDRRITSAGSVPVTSETSQPTRATQPKACMPMPPAGWAISRCPTLFTWIEPALRSSDLLPGPKPHAWNVNHPAYEFPTGHPHARVLVRRVKNAQRWLIGAWAADGVERVVTVNVPELGEHRIVARAAGTVHLVDREGDKRTVHWLDEAAMTPSLTACGLNLESPRTTK